MTAMSSPVRVLLTARPATATSSGRPAATTEPKVMSRISAAAARPMASEPISAASPWVTVCPPRATSSPGRVGVLGDRDHPLAGRDRHVDRVDHVEAGGGAQRGAVLRDRARRLVGVLDRLDVGDPADLVEQPGDLAAYLGGVDAVRRPHHDVDGVAGLGREARLEQVLGLAGVGAGGGVVGLVVAAERRDQADGQGERREPAEDDPAAAAEGDVGQAAEGAGALGGRVGAGGLRRARRRGRYGTWDGPRETERERTAAPEPGAALCLITKPRCRHLSRGYHVCNAP